MSIAMLTRQIPVLGALVGLAVVFGFVMANRDYNIQGSLLVGAALSILMLFFLLPRVASGEGKLFLQFLVMAFFLKTGASFFRFYWSFGVKAGSADSSRYHRTGRFLADSFWHLDFGQILPYLRPGTPFLEAVTGIVYAFIELLLWWSLLA